MTEITQTLTIVLNEIKESIPKAYYPYIVVAAFSAFIVLYLLFVWKFYRFLSKRDILELELNKYNTSEHPVLYKFFASLLFLLEYIIIIPIIVFFWFFIFSLFLLFLSKNHDVGNILLISASLVASIRMLSYYSEELSSDIAKLFPFTLLVVLLIEEKFFSITLFIDKFAEIPDLFGNIFAYLIFIIGIEIFMRFLLVCINFFSHEE